MFKNEWEKTQTRVQIEDQIILQILQQALPDRVNYAYEQMSGGCANLNYKVTFTDDATPLLLRIYIRDPDSAYREQKIGELFKEKRDIVPVAEIYTVGDCEGYRYALVEFMFGVLLRDLLLHYAEHEWMAPLRAVGNALGAIGMVEFPAAGFFDSELSVTKPFMGKGIEDEVFNILHNPAAMEYLGTEKAKRIHEIVLKHEALLPGKSYHHLVHGDFDPSNIMLGKQDNRWHITAILDWEFAFSGSCMWDVSNMLRYAHRMPAAYQESFLFGLKDAGVVLPEQWRKITHLLSLVSLVEAVARGNPKASPKQYADMFLLIDYQIEQLNI